MAQKRDRFTMEQDLHPSTSSGSELEEMNMESGFSGSSSSSSTINKKSGPHIISIEAAIGCGKSTLLGLLSKYFGNRIKIVYEPLEMWQNVEYAVSQEDDHDSTNIQQSSNKPKRKLKRDTPLTSSMLFLNDANENFNALDLFYKNTRRFAYAFQGYVFMTRVKKIEAAIKELEEDGCLDDTLIVVERSWITDGPTFLELLRDDGTISEIEYRMHKNWLSWLIPRSPQISGCVYLRATTDVVMNRLKIRARSEESTMDISYQRKLIEKHDKLFLTKDIIDDGDDEQTEAQQEERINMNNKSLLISNIDRVMSSEEINLNLPCLVIDANREFQSDEERLHNIFIQLSNFLKTHGILQHRPLIIQESSSSSSKETSSTEIERDNGKQFVVCEPRKSDLDILRKQNIEEKDLHSVWYAKEKERISSIPISWKHNGGA